MWVVEDGIKFCEVNSHRFLAEERACVFPLLIGSTREKVMEALEFNGESQGVFFNNVCKYG